MTVIVEEVYKDEGSVRFFKFDKLTEAAIIGNEPLAELQKYKMNVVQGFKEHDPYNVIDFPVIDWEDMGDINYWIVSIYEGNRLLDRLKVWYDDEAKVLRSRRHSIEA